MVLYTLDELQYKAAQWVQSVWGKDVALDVRERSLRMVEEAIEVVQVNAIPRETLHRLVDIVYDKPVGEGKTEIGQLLFVMGSLAQAMGIDMTAAVNDVYTEAQRPARILKVKENNIKKKELGL